VKGASPEVNPGGKRKLLFCGGLCVGVFLLETLDAAGGVHKFLLASEKRVAIGADFDAQHIALDRGAGWKRIAAGTMHGD
jgi:hypothetical protein